MTKAVRPPTTQATADALSLAPIAEQRTPGFGLGVSLAPSSVTANVKFFVLTARIQRSIRDRVRGIGHDPGDARQGGGRSFSTGCIMKKAVAILLGIGLIGGATQALAGLKQSFTVVISAISFGGTLGDIRASSDTRQYLGCVTRSGYAGTCTAKDASNVTKTCVFNTTNGLDRAVALIGNMSNVVVWYDANGYCTDIQVDNSSYNRPMVP
jgi:hypothetical protein